MKRSITDREWFKSSSVI